jgi:putative ATP-dependent endonuclease of OLD family
MRVIEIQIHNFRSIADVTIMLREISLLAGANNSGKSNVIDAIRMFYGDLKWVDEKDTPKFAPSDEESWIELEFSPSSDELSQLKDEYRTSDGTFRVRNYLKSGKGPDGKARAGYYAYVDGKLSETLFYGAKNVGSGKVGKIVYIPAVSKIDDHTKLSGPSALRDLVANVLSKVISGSKSYSDLSTAFSVFETGIKAQESDDGQSLHALEVEITSELTLWETEFNLEIQSIQPDDLIKSLIKPRLVDQTHGGEIDQTRFGAGFQRNLIYLLIKLAAKYAAGEKSDPPTKKEFSPELTWILFEEPEAFLHPTQEEVLYVLLSTHSSRFVSRSLDDLTRLVRLRRDEAKTTTYQLTQDMLDGLFDAAHVSDSEISQQVIDPGDIDTQKLMSALKIELWMQPQRASAFFSKWVVLVEGMSEVALYNYMVNRRIMKAPGPGIVFIDCMGKFNIHRFMGLLNAFGVDHAVLYDGDDGTKKDVEVTKAINDASGVFTHRVTRLSSDLETELGIIPLPKNESHRKPQYILYQLEASRIEKTKLDSFATMVVTLCSPDVIAPS